MFRSSAPRAKTAPSHYPRLPFHGLRLVQFISSCIVMSVMAYFIYHLQAADYSAPWTFILLLAASLFSVISVAFTGFMHCCIGLNPRLNLLINGFLIIPWAVSWSLLTWYTSGTLSGYCNVENWKDGTGVMVCRVYKALFTFSLLALLSTIGAFFLDIHVRRQQTRSGIYRLHDIETTNHKRDGSRDVFFPDDHQFAPAYHPHSQGQGYTAPDSQYKYDTAYAGGHHERA